MGATTATPGMGNAFSCPWTVTSVGPTHPVTASSLAQFQIEQQNAKNLLTPVLPGGFRQPSPGGGESTDPTPSDGPQRLRETSPFWLRTDLHAIVYVTLSFTLEIAYPFDPVTKVVVCILAR